MTARAIRERVLATGMSIRVSVPTSERLGGLIEAADNSVAFALDAAGSQFSTAAVREHLSRARAEIAKAAKAVGRGRKGN